MLTRTIQGRDYYAYSFHRTYDAACEALEDYFASDQVSAGEHPLIAPTRDKKIRRDGVAWTVMFLM